MACTRSVWPWRIHRLDSEFFLKTTETETRDFLYYRQVLFSELGNKQLEVEVKL